MALKGQKEHRVQSSYAQLTITGHNSKETGAAPDPHPASANPGIPAAKEHLNCPNTVKGTQYIPMFGLYHASLLASTSTVKVIRSVRTLVARVMVGGFTQHYIVDQGRNGK